MLESVAEETITYPGVFLQVPFTEEQLAVTLSWNVDRTSLKNTDTYCFLSFLLCLPEVNYRVWESNVHSAENQV